VTEQVRNLRVDSAVSRHGRISPAGDLTERVSGFGLWRWGAIGAVLVASTVVWTVLVGSVDLRDVGDLGLVSALPPMAAVPLAVVVLGLAMTLRSPYLSVPLAVAVIVVLVFMLYGAPTLVEEAHRLNITWRHAGIADEIMRTGSVDAGVDAYFSWPGFFFLASLLTEVAGESSTLALSDWAPVAFNLLYLLPLVVITKAITSDRRLAYTAIAIFYLTNWIGQDYFSPQGAAFFTYLAVLGLLLRFFQPRPGERRAPLPRQLRGIFRLPLWLDLRPSIHDEGEQPTLRPRQRAALLLVCVLCIAMGVGSHQLTPFSVLVAVTALVLVGRCTARGLPAIALTLLFSWMGFIAIAYFYGHIGEVTGSVGDVNTSVSKNVGGRVSGSSEHLFIVYARIGMTAALWALATAGAVRRLRQGHRDVAVGVLATVPFLLVVLQPYGGEVLLRAYLFSLPFVSFYAAAAILPDGDASLTRARSVALIAAFGVLLAGFAFTRYGNERVNLFTYGEAATVERLYELAPPGSLLIAPAPELPWQGENYVTHRHELLRAVDVGKLKRKIGKFKRKNRLARGLAKYLRERKASARFVIITRSQRAHDEMFGSQQWGRVAELESQLAASRAFVRVFDNGDGVIYKLRERGRRRA
jgi:hypothetical protein